MILYIRKYFSKIRKKRLVVEKRYITSNSIIPIGHDCHPAYLLNKLNIRKQSLPFDWLSTKPLHGLKYVVDNINTDFNFFLAALQINKRGNIISAHYPVAEFIHEKTMIEDDGPKKKYLRRIDRFKKLLKNHNCSFLYFTSSIAYISTGNVNYFIGTVNNFMQHIKESDKLFVCIRYDESYDENWEHCERLYNELTNINKVKVIKYIRNKEKYGIWGDESKYYKLLKKFGYNIKPGFPKLYIK